MRFLNGETCYLVCVSVSNVCVINTIYQNRLNTSRDHINKKYLQDCISFIYTADRNKNRYMILGSHISIIFVITHALCIFWEIESDK